MPTAAFKTFVRNRESFGFQISDPAIPSILASLKTRFNHKINNFKFLLLSPPFSYLIRLVQLHPYFFIIGRRNLNLILCSKIFIKG